MSAEHSLKMIRNFVAIDARIGTAGQPAPDQWALIAEAGYSTVINLAMPDHIESVDTEGARVTGLGMNYIHLPVPFDAPTPRQVRRFCDIMDALGSEKVFVHCIMNYRVSAFLYLYLKHRRGYGEKEARSPMFEHWQPNPVWQKLLAWDNEAIRR